MPPVHTLNFQYRLIPPPIHLADTPPGRHPYKREVPSPSTNSPSASRQPSRQQSFRRLSSIDFLPRNPSTAGPLASHAFGHHDVSTINGDLLAEGDVVGEGDALQGELIEPVDI